MPEKRLIIDCKFMVKSTKLKISDSKWLPKFRKTEQIEIFL